MRDDNCEKQGVSRFYTNDIYQYNEPIDEEKVTGDFESRIENSTAQQHSYVDTYAQEYKEDLYTDTDFDTEETPKERRPHAQQHQYSVDFMYHVVPNSSLRHRDYPHAPLHSRVASHVTN